VSKPWVFVEELERAGSISLLPDEVRHVAARRLRVGDSLVEFEGRGHKGLGKIESLSKSSSVVAVDSIIEAERPDSAFVLASAIPEGARLSTMLQMLTQLGLDSWQPLVLEDSAVRKLDPNSKRRVRILSESYKVSRRPWMLDVRDPCLLEDALTGRSSEDAIYFGDREGEAVGFDAPVGTVVIGPEAGFSESERKILRDVGAQPRSVGAHNLRIETAATVALHLARRGDSSRIARE
jgi:16S rRNA (uracil1498-N3)-methyltransferase